MNRIILIRHGHSKTNEENIFAGHFDTPLTEQGVKQAEITAEYVAKNYDVDIIFTSDLKRARITAEKLATLTNKEIICSQKLREINGGEWQEKPYADLSELYPEDYSVWQKDMGKAVCTGGESVKELYDRINEEIEKIINNNPNKNITIVTHATPIRVFTAKVMGYTVEELAKVNWVPNASVSVFKIENGKIEIEILGENSFHGELATVLPKTV